MHTLPDQSGRICWTLAAQPGSEEILSVFLWSVLAACVAVAGFYAAAAVRRWAQRSQSTGSFTLQDLREMRARGQITEQEFAAMRAAMLARFDVTSTVGPPSSGPSRHPEASDDGQSAPGPPDP